MSANTGPASTGPASTGPPSTEPASTRGERRVVVADLVGGAIIIAVGAVFVVDATSYGVLGESGRLEPGAMPFFSGLLLALCGLGVLVGGLRGRRADAQALDAPPATSVASSPAAGTELTEGDAAASDPATAGDTGDDRMPADAVSEPETSTGRALLVLGVAAVTTFLAPYLGFLLAFGLMIVGLLVVLERERWWKGVVLAAGAVTFSYLLFVRFLSIPLPSGFLPF